VTTTREVHNGQDIIDSRDVIARIQELEEARDAVLEGAEKARDDLKELRTRELAADDGEWTPEDQAALEVAQDAVEALWMAEDGSEYGESADWGEDEEKEWKALKSLEEQAEGSADWAHGEALIRDSYFEDYARELAEDIGAMKDCDHWPANCIDWERAARELQMDYTSVEFDDVTYWIRS
jgi:hypothetical protein